MSDLMGILTVLGIITGTLLGLILLVIWKDIRPFFQPKNMYVFIIEPDRSRRTHWMKPTDGSFIIEDVGEKFSYTLTPDCVYKTGKFNVGTCYYRRNIPAPINFQKLEYSGQSAKDAFESQESHVAKELMESSRPVSISLMMVVLLSAVVTIASVGILYWKLNGSITELAASIDPQPQPVPAQTNAR